ncbi:MAG: S-ribosylhomocysteine lyase [Paludibacteraceae bacterium]|nr:S-ribosylhomocysteine lyase [Paludibacteraceae bacterium]
MKKIASFTIDHIHMLRGIYLSRTDNVGNETITTFDIRMKEPNREPALSIEALHVMEHLAATFLRNHVVWADRLIYWGPMGCCTGNYLVVRGKLLPQDMVAVMQETFQFIADFEGDIPGMTPRDCGNYSLQDLPAAKKESRKFLVEVLHEIKSQNMEYPSED